MVLGLIVAFSIVVLIDLPGLYKANNKRTTALAYFFLLVTGFVICLLLVMDKVPTSPAIIIEKMVKFVLLRGRNG